jgi:hypothetical protein
MSDEQERCREQEAFRRIDAAFRVGDFEDLRTALGDPAGFSAGRIRTTRITPASHR